MKRIGVTGGIGSGKSTVCRHFEALGARVFYADLEAKRLMQERADVRAELIQAFGAESYDAEGRLDRAYLARRVFNDSEALAQINAIVHPRVREALVQATRDAEADGVPLLVYEAALLFESGGDRFVDAVVVVDAPEDERVRRVVARDGVMPAEVRARMQHQLPAATLRARADYVLDNSGAPEAVQREVERLYRLFTTEA